jgi:hypothetical protein
VLTPYDVIDGSNVPGFPGLYVVGCYDSRITFYSQQVRALELAYALHEQQHLQPNARIAVIGGGASGVTLAAALALTGNVTVMLFERADVLLPLQRGSTRRRIDPHIYDWPREDADHEFAELPLLDWRAGPANEVRYEVISEFNDVVEKVAPRIEVLQRHEVMAVRKAAAGYEIEFERERNTVEAEARPDRVSDRIRVDLVMCAFGFGLEPTRPIPNVITESYWDDAGVPGPDITGRARPRFFVSGNGDGGLIDFVAAASADFNHTTTISAIVRQAGVGEIFERLKAIDIEARQVHASGNHFDFVAAYDTQIYQHVSDLGLVALMRARLRPGVQLTLQTRDKELMSVKTATLNRLAVYLVIKACEQDSTATFRHIYCPEVAPVVPPSGAGPANYWFDCGGEVIGADKAIFRRGPQRQEARQPFEDVLAGFANHHDAWLTRHIEDTVAPMLSDAARAHFVRRCKEHSIPMSRHLQEVMGHHMPLRAKVQRSGNDIRWTGDFTASDASRIWDHAPNVAYIVCNATPEELGPAAAALARLVIHAEHTVLFAQVPAWRPFLEQLTSESRHAEDLMVPDLRAIGVEGAILNPQRMSTEVLRQRLNAGMDRWMLNAINDHLEGYLANDRDPGSRVGFLTAPMLRNQMRAVWGDWRGKFERDPNLLSRFLRLTVCALDTDETVDVAYALVGRRKLKGIVRSTAVALAVATGWNALTPRAQRPGNLTRAHGVDPVRTGHICAADRIDGELMALSAAKFMWRTHFVVLPMVNGPSGFAALADISLLEPRMGHLD